MTRVFCRLTHSREPNFVRYIIYVVDWISNTNQIGDFSNFPKEFPKKIRNANGNKQINKSSILNFYFSSTRYICVRGRAI